MTFTPEFPVVFLVATYGDGEPTDSALEFYSWLVAAIQSSKQSLKNVHFCVFGLGNRTYEKFNIFAKDLDSMLEKLDARRLIELTLGDDDQKYIILWLI